MKPNRIPLPGQTLIQGAQQLPERTWWRFWNDLANDIYAVPSSLALITGTFVSGNVASVQQMLDGSTYNLTEVGGTPGYELDFTFSNVQFVPSEAVLRIWYQEPAIVTHDVTIDLYNWGTAAWDQVSAVLPTFNQKILSLPLPTFGVNYLNNGNAKMRVYHNSSGNANHSLHVDYVALRG